MKEKEKGDDSDRIVWAFIVIEDDLDIDFDKDPLVQNITKVFRPNHITKRITSQNGWFTVHKFDKDEIIPFDQDRPNFRMFKMKIPENIRNDVLDKLEVMGVNNFSLFPDLEGLSHYLDWKFK